MANNSLHRAKKNRNDEFYTTYQCIENEVEHYYSYNPNVFAGHRLLLPCDDWEKSQFVAYFSDNFERFNLQSLTATCFGERGKMFVKTANKTTCDLLKGNGSFLSHEVTAIAQQCDMIVTNPPFSMFREFLPWVGEKKFLLMSNMNTIGYKDVNPLILQGKIWMGATNDSQVIFATPLSTEVKPSHARYCQRRGYRAQDGLHYTVLGNTCWLTNMEYDRYSRFVKTQPMADILTNTRHKKIVEHGFPRYLNFDGIDVPFSDSIPSDFDGIMGVPISFLFKHNPEQFEIVGFRYGDDGKDLTTAAYAPYVRLLIRRKN
ncbi:adenine-specific methyltransferase EcoRI family protein [Actinomyces vulturis]|uniref:adenine-specific methyltransferase EcoRI family protein n=1 Tax=Actinomyces vulturis TaxID=1857645 RepID=UPI00082ADB8A|nr:adenine-specific methyltransferase EcoRI family protein [Actinomyces vulturis]